MALALGWTIAACDAPPRSTAADGEVATSSSAAPATAEDGVREGVVLVYRSPTCGCCGAWAEHLREHGFAVDVRDVPDMTEVKRRLGVPPALASCHTAVVDGRIVEGHVPADALRRFLEDDGWSGMSGLAVPGMPVGSPGMESPGRAADPYDVVAWDSTGATVVFERRSP